MLHWSLYVLLFPPVPSITPPYIDHTTFLTMMLIIFLTVSCGVYSSAFFFLVLLGESALSLPTFVINTKPSPIYRIKRRRPRPNWKRARKFRRRALQYWLVRRCRRRPRHRPPRLNGSFFPSPLCNKLRRWRRRRARARTFFSRRKLDVFLGGRKDRYCPWDSDKVSSAVLDSFCDNESTDFLKLSRLLSTFRLQDHAANVEALLHRAAILRGQIFESRILHECAAKDPRTMMLVWDTGASYGLTPFRSDFIDYVKCDIPGKDVTK